MTAGGAREGAGRKAGSVNRRHSEVVAEALAVGQTPLEYMLAVFRDEEADPKRRDWAAEKAAPYLHARPSPLDRTVRMDLPDTSTIAGVDAALDKIIAAIAGEKLAPAEGQSLISVIEARRKAIENGEILARLQKLEEQAEKGAK